MAQGGALGSAEAVLLVCYRQPEAGYLYVRADDGVGADQQTDGAQLSCVQDGAACPGRRVRAGVFAVSNAMLNGRFKPSI